MDIVDNIYEKILSLFFENQGLHNQNPSYVKRLGILAERIQWPNIIEIVMGGFLTMTLKFRLYYSTTEPS